MAFSHLQHLLRDDTDTESKREHIVYSIPPHFGNKFASRFLVTEEAPVLVRTENMSVAFVASESIQNLPLNTLIDLQVQFVTHQISSNQTDSSGKLKSKDCTNRQDWETTLDDIEDNIESFFPLKKWKICKNLAREILSNPNFCITKDGKSFHLMKKPRNSKVNLLSFLGLATRKPGPMEKTKKPEWNVYNLHIRELVNNGTPKELFVNTLLLQNNNCGSGGTRKKIKTVKREKVLKKW